MRRDDPAGRSDVERLWRRTIGAADLDALGPRHTYQRPDPGAAVAETLPGAPSSSR